MKKKISLCLILFFAVGALSFSQVIEDDSDATEAWNDFKESGKKALESTSNFLKAAGADIKESINNLKEVKCIGTWIYKGKNCTTTITINDDGTMEVEQKEGFLKSTSYKGTYTQVLHSLNFKITEKGSKAWVVKTDDDEEASSDLWFISYATQDDSKKMKFTTTDFPQNSDKTDFSKGVIFTKK